MGVVDPDRYGRMVAPTTEALIKTGCRPAWFGLGFIQLKLSSSTRMHFWHPDLPADLSEDEIHDHRYPFVSWIVAGQLHHHRYEFIQSSLGSHELVEVSCKPGSSVPPCVIAYGNPLLIGSAIKRTGESYQIEAGRFHRVEVRKAATVLRRGPIMSDVARVIRRPHQPHICPFARSIPEPKLWEIIADVLDPTAH